MSEKKYTEQDIERAKAFVDSLLEKPEFQEELKRAKDTYKAMCENEGGEYWAEALTARKKISYHVLGEMKKTDEFDMFFENKDSMFMYEYDDIVGQRIEANSLRELASKYGELPSGFLEAKGNSSDVMTVAEYKTLLAEAKDFKPQQKVQGEVKDGDSLEGGDPKPAEKTDELAADEIQLVGKEDDVNVDQDWVQRYEAIMKQYAADNQQEWVREEKNEEGQPHEGLKGKIGEAEYHFTAPDKAKSNLAGIDGVVALASKTGQSLAYNEKWSDEFKAEVLKACEKYGVSIEGMPEQVKENTEEKEEPTPAPVEKEEPESTYRLDPKIAAAKMKGLYVRTDDADEGKKATKVKALETEIKKQEELLAGRAYQVTGEEKATADLLMKKYVLAQRQGNQEMADTCALALQRYGVDKIERVPNSDEGIVKVTGKPYSERTDEEKGKINEALDKALPKKQEQYNPEVFQQLAQAKQAGQVH